MSRKVQKATPAPVLEAEFDEPESQLSGIERRITTHVGKTAECLTEIDRILDKAFGRELQGSGVTDGETDAGISPDYTAFRIRKGLSMQSEQVTRLEELCARLRNCLG